MSLVTPIKSKPGASHLEFDVGEGSDEQGTEGEAIEWKEIDEVIGPTPQKNGRFLGLFDSLVPEALVHGPVSPVPVKRKSDEAFPMPKRGAGKNTKSPLKTPSFLRKQVIAIDADGSIATPRLLFPALPKRGLSLLINELRDLEDNDEDEGLSVLREMEGNLANVDESEQADGKNDMSIDATDVEVNEKVKWKKKGLKRSHRRVIMRPSTNKKKEIETEDTAQVPKRDDDSDEYINSADEAADEIAAQGLQHKDSSENVASADKQTKSKSTTGARKPRTGPQNFKSLKLCNRGGKGGGRFRGRGRS